MRKSPEELIAEIIEKCKECPDSELIKTSFLRLHASVHANNFRYEEFSNAFDFLAMNARHLLKEYFYTGK